MATYEYTARGHDGGLVEARMDASSVEAVAAELLEAGITPVRIAPAARQAAGVEGLLRRYWPQRVELEELIVLSRQLATLVRAGVPIVRAIVGLATSARNPTLAAALTDVADGLRAGRELSVSLQRHPDVFSNLYANVVQVGEATGKLDDALKELAHYLELERETRRRIKSAMRYPMMVMGAIAGAMVIINLFVIPAFAETFADLGAELPWATLLLIAVSDFFVRAWPFLGIGAIGAVAGWRAWVRTPRGRYLWDRTKLRFPVVGSIVLRATIARYARSFFMAFEAGVPVNRTLDVVARAVDNEYVAERIHAVRSSIERGETLTRAAAGCGLFTPLVLQMLAVGEETGALGEMHRHVAESYEEEVDYDLRRMTELLEPLLIVGVGAIVLLLALGVYLPMWDFSNAMRVG